MTGFSLAVCTTVYPAAAPFLRAWHDSVLAQTDQSFDLWISVDGMSEEDAVRAMGGRPRPRTVWLAVPPGTPKATIRQQAFDRMLDRYDGVVLVDCDDVMLPCRVAGARRALEDADLAACALIVIDEAGADLGLTFAPAAGTDPIAMLPRCNVFGFSNSTWRAAVLRRCLPIPPQTVLFDWLLATRAWSLGARLRFDPEPCMRYRQYGANTAPVLTPFTAPQVRAATARVLEHYRDVLDDEWPLPEPQRSAVAAARGRCTGFARAIAASPKVLDAYVAALNRLTPQHVWWWSVAHPQLEEIWKS